MANYFKIAEFALAGVAQWIEHWPTNQRVAGSIPGQSTCLGLQARSPVGEHMRGNYTLMFLSLSFCLSSPLSKINK